MQQGVFFYLQRLEMGIPQAGKATGFWQWVTVLSWMQPELVSALSPFHTCTHTLLGQLQPLVMAQGEPNCCFPSLGLEASKCVKCTCASVNPQLLENTLDWTGQIASGNVLNVQKVENMGGVGEPVWDSHCSLKRVRMDQGSSEARFVIVWGKHMGNCICFAAAINREQVLK